MNINLEKEVLIFLRKSEISEELFYYLLNLTKKICRDKNLPVEWEPFDLTDKDGRYLDILMGFIEEIIITPRFINCLNVFLNNAKTDISVSSLINTYLYKSIYNFIIRDNYSLNTKAYRIIKKISS